MLVLEEDCREIERNLDGFQGIFRESAGRITEATKRQVRVMLVEILDKVARIKLDLGLPKQTVDLDRLIESRLSHIWVTLHESRTQSLRGYGAVPEKLKEYLDPRVKEILRLLARVREALQGRGVGGERRESVE
jgi:hypothetical protein